MQLIELNRLMKVDDYDRLLDVFKDVRTWLAQRPIQQSLA